MFSMCNTCIVILQSYSHARPEVLDRPMWSCYNEDAKWIPASVKAQKNEPPWDLDHLKGALLVQSTRISFGLSLTAPLPVKPFANVVRDYTCCDREKKWFQHSQKHLPSVTRLCMGSCSVTCIVYHTSYCTKNDFYVCGAFSLLCAAPTFLISHF